MNLKGNMTSRYMGKTLRDGTKRCCPGNGEIRDSIAHNWIAGGGRDSEEILPRFSGCKGDMGWWWSKNILLDFVWKYLQNSVKIV